MYYNNWFNKGIKYIEQIYDYRYRQFYDFAEMVNLFNLSHTDVFRYIQIITAIPKTWKVRLKSEQICNQTDTNLVDDVLKTQKASRFLYCYQMINLKQKPITSQEKWNSIFGNDINWGNVYLNAVTSNRNPKIRNFQYKYLMRIVPTNKYLMKCKILSSNLCDFCNSYVETLNHMYWECTYTQIFWNELKLYLTTAGIEITFNLEKITFGLNEGPHKTVKNFITMNAKYFIYINKYSRTIPNINNFIRYLKHNIEIEKVIAMQNDKLDIFNELWSFFRF